MRFNFRLCIFIAATLIIFSSCIKKPKIVENVKQDSAEVSVGINKRIYLKKDREIFKVLTGNDNLRSDYTIVLSHLRTNSSNKFDRVDFYKEDNNNLIKVLSDTTDFGYDYKISADNESEYLYLFTDIGGTDTISSKGAFIYYLGKDKPELVKYFDGGSLRSYLNDANGKNEFVLFDNYIGVLPAGKYITYTAGVFYLNKQNFENDLETSRMLFAQNSIIAKKEYDSVKAVISSGLKIKSSEYPLYFQAINFFLYNVSLADITVILKFWNEESDYLKKYLPEDEYGDLENFVTKVKVNLKNT